VPEQLNFGWSDQERSDFIQFAVYNLGLAVPFFFGGGAVGLILSAYAHRIHAVYASDLLGAGFGCLLCPMLLWPFGAGGCLLVVAVLGLLALWAVAPARLRRGSGLAAVALGITCAVLIPSFDKSVPIPGKSFLRLTQNANYNPNGVPHIYSRWSTNSRIDVGKSDEVLWLMLAMAGPDMRAMDVIKGQHAADPVAAAKALREAFGEQKYIMQDGDAGTFLTNLSDEKAGARGLLSRSLYSLTASMKQDKGSRVFVIGVGGGNDIWANKLAGASKIRGIELNYGVLDVHRTVGKEFSKGILEDPNIELVNDEGRSALMRDDGSYDIVQMTGIDTWTALTSGAYVLAENYLYTVEAMMQMYSHLADGGVIQVTRMGDNMEKLRLLSNIYEAFRRLGVADFQDSVAIVTSSSSWDKLAAVMIKKGKFTAEEVAHIESFATKNEHQLSYLPQREIAGVVQDFVRTEDKAKFIADFPRAISPTTDDLPYFFNFTRWDTPPAEAKQYLNELTSMSQGNPLFIWGQLVFSSVIAVLLIVVPLLFRRSQQKGAHSGRFLIYFAGIGAGFIFIEIALIQKLTLLLGQPLYSIVVTLFSILIFTGLGSSLSGKWLDGGRSRVRAIPLGILLMLVAWVALGTPIVDMFIGTSIAVRSVVAGVLIAPVALLLGVPFAHGVRLLSKTNPHFVPWAWAVNGSATVVGSVATVIVSMNFGFNAVLLCAAAIYAVAFLAVDRLAR
jgi:spermidine synthase